MSYSLKSFIRSKVVSVAFPANPLCGCNTTILSRKWNSTILLKHRNSSYYSFPLFTGTQYILENFHHYSMLPWWATILSSTLILRTVVTLPFAVKQNKLIAKMELLKPTLQEITDAVKHNIIVRGQRDGKEKSEIQREIVKELRLYTKDFQKRNGVAPIKLMLLPWMQLPLWITVSFALRNISGFTPKDSDPGANSIFIPSSGIETEGLLWFSNLAVPDPLYVLPLVLLVTNLLNIELSSIRQQSPSTFSKIITKVFRGITVLVFVVSTQVPSAMSLYWASSSSYGLAQNLLLKMPSFRRKLKIPKTPSEHEKPFMHISDVLKARTRRFLEIQRGETKK